MKELKKCIINSYTFFFNWGYFYFSARYFSDPKKNIRLLNMSVSF